MKFTISRGELLAALSSCARIVGKSTIPILGNAHLRAAPGGVTITTTDLELSISIACAAKVETPGEITLPAKQLHDFARRLPEAAEILFELLDGFRVSMRAGRSKAIALGLAATDYPVGLFGDHAFDAALDVEAGELARILARALPCASGDAARFYLMGVYLHPVEVEGAPALRAVATDGAALTQSHLLLYAPASFPGVIVPEKAAVEIQKIAAAHKGTLRLSVSSVRVELAAGPIMLTSKVIDGTYPDYPRVIPLGATRIATLEREELAAAAGRVATFADGGKSGPVLRLDFGPSGLTIAARDFDKGAAEELVDADYDGAPLTIGFAARLLDELLAQIPGDTIRLEMIDAGSPMLLRSLAGSPELSVLMPCRVSAHGQ